MISLHGSFSKALAIMHILLAEAGSDDSVECCIEAYQNGREQGITILDYRHRNKAFYVAEFRRSDNIVVYEGSYSMQSISDDAYENSKLFKYNEYYEASQYILEQLRKE